ncbi:hypothetical protein [Acidicapsa acidisoli]|uniref:hypothetical protein n=1 Tax=Acidicapsa acidisoli TaxID=1615681 RepID=UPI0021DFDCEA|nr:hypothetical protein [Acidicapsa acidisoli]
MNNDMINAALDIGEKYGVARREATITAPRVCAVHNRRYAAIYLALPNGRYRFKECVPAGKAGVGEAKMQTVELSQIDNEWVNPEKCLWCGNAVIARCGKCTEFVCCGRVTGNVFKCCDACGCEGAFSGTYSSFTGSKQAFTAALKATFGHAALRAPGNTLMLTRGGKR